MSSSCLALHFPWKPYVTIFNVLASFFVIGNTFINLLTLVWCCLPVTQAADENYRCIFLHVSGLLPSYILKQHIFRLIASGHELKKLDILVLVYQYMNMVMYGGACLCTHPWFNIAAVLLRICLAHNSTSWRKAQAGTL